MWRSTTAHMQSMETKCSAPLRNVANHGLVSARQHVNFCMSELVTVAVVTAAELGLGAAEVVEPEALVASASAMRQ